MLNNLYRSSSLLARGFSLNDLRLLGATLSTYADTAMQILHLELSLSCAVFLVTLSAHRFSNMTFMSSVIIFCLLSFKNYISIFNAEKVF